MMREEDHTVLVRTQWCSITTQFIPPPPPPQVPTYAMLPAMYVGHLPEPMNLMNYNLMSMTLPGNHPDYSMGSTAVIYLSHGKP